MSHAVANPFRFNLEKAIQAAGVILRQEPGGRINYMKLLKLLEIAERESLRHSGTTITGDRLVAMERGPLPSNIYDLIKGEHISLQRWETFICREGYHVALRENPGVSRLSRFEIETLQEVATRHANHDEWEMVKITHEFEEWTKNKPDSGSSRDIPIRDVLLAVGKSEEEADAILSEADAQQQMDQFFSRNGACGRRMPSQSPESTTTSKS